MHDELHPLILSVVKRERNLPSEHGPARQEAVVLPSILVRTHLASLGRPIGNLALPSRSVMPTKTPYDAYVLQMFGVIETPSKQLFGEFHLLFPLCIYMRMFVATQVLHISTDYDIFPPLYKYIYFRYHKSGCT